MRVWRGGDGGAVPVPLQGRQSGCLHHDLSAAPRPTRALKPNRASPAPEKKTGAGAKVPRVLWWSLFGRRRLHRAERPEEGAHDTVQGAEPKESLPASSGWCWGPLIPAVLLRLSLGC